jgi:hypothetical protein
VRWLPAAYVGGLLYGFSPFVLASLEYGPLMTAALMLLPLILAVLDEILVRQRHSARKAGVALGLLVFAQFFLSSELLVVVIMLTVFSVAVMVVTAYVADRERLRVLVPHASTALGVGTVVGGVLLAYPVLFALTGPAHLSGVFWPNIDTLDGITRSLLVNPTPNRTLSVVAAYGGYEGSPLPSGSYLGWGLIIVLAAGTAVWFRDRRLWFYGLLLATCVVCSFDLRTGPWVPARFFAHVPLVENILPQRFMAVGFLAAAVMVALIIDRARSRLPGRLGLRGLGGNLVGISGALGVGAVALAPLAINFLPDLPFTMEAVVLPRWYTAVAPHLPPGRVLLPYPVAYSGIQVALAWQAVNRMAYSQAGGAGPEGTSIRAGRAEPGFDVLSVLSLGFSLTEPNSTPANLAAVSGALRIWKVNTVVIAPEPLGLADQQGHDPSYAAAYMTAVLGRLPIIQAGAWVWDDVHIRPRSSTAAGVVADSVLQGCVRQYETKTPAGVVTASMGVPRCVADHLGRPTASTS